MVEDIKKKSIKECRKINHCLYLNKKGTVYKNCEESLNYPCLLPERLSFVDDIPCDNGFTKPISLLRDDRIYGYEMPYLKSYQTILEYIERTPKSNSPIKFEDKKEMMLRQIQSLKEINRYFAVGDINLGNIMVHPNLDSVIIDWENGTPNISDYPILCLYHVRNCNNYVQEDSIKLFICILSLLYEIDFESVLENLSVDSIAEILHDLKVNKNIISFLNDATYEIMLGSNAIVYFDEYLKSMKPVTERKRILAKKGIEHLYIERAYNPR